jgi:hypothetical protein
MRGIRLAAAAERRQRLADDRKEYLVRTLNQWGVFEHGKQPLHELNLIELENIHINEACRRGRN